MGVACAPAIAQLREKRKSKFRKLRMVSFRIWDWKNAGHNHVVIGYVTFPDSGFALGGNREAASVAEGFG